MLNFDAEKSANPPNGTRRACPLEGDKGGGKPPPGKGEGGSYWFSNTPRAVGPANFVYLMSFPYWLLLEGHQHRKPKLFVDSLV